MASSLAKHGMVHRQHTTTIVPHTDDKRAQPKMACRKLAWSMYVYETTRFSKLISNKGNLHQLLL